MPSPRPPNKSTRKNSPKNRPAPALCLGLDLGGTNIKAGIVDAGGRVLDHISLPTGEGADLSANTVIKRLAIASRQAAYRADIPLSKLRAIGITSPGEVQPHTGIVASAANFPTWKNVPLAKKLAAALNTSAPIHLENDAKAAAYAEWWVGAGRGSKTMLLVTLGTGVGGGIVHNGQLLRGTTGLAGEIGHMILFPGGDLCGCGQRGCVEQYCSAHFFAQRTTNLLHQHPHLLKESSLGRHLAAKGAITATDIEHHARKHDRFSRTAWLDLARNLAITCINAARILDPDRIILAGGLANAGTYLLTPVRNHFKKEWWKLAKPPAKIRLTTLQNHAGIIGAAGLAVASASPPMFVKQRKPT